MKAILIIAALFGATYSQAKTFCGDVILVPIFTPPGYSESSFIFSSHSKSIPAYGVDSDINLTLVAAAKAKQPLCVDGVVESDGITDALKILSIENEI